MILCPEKAIEITAKITNINLPMSQRLSPVDYGQRTKFPCDFTNLIDLVHSTCDV